MAAKPKSILDELKHYKVKYPRASDQWPKDLLEELDEVARPVASGKLSGRGYGETAVFRVFAVRMKERKLKAPTLGAFRTYWHARLAELRR